MLHLFPGSSLSFQALENVPKVAQPYQPYSHCCPNYRWKCWQACLYLQSCFISEAQRGETRQARAASQAQRKRGCSAGKQEPSDKETIPAGRTRFWRPSHQQLLQEQGCKSHKPVIRMDCSFCSRIFLARAAAPGSQCPGERVTLRGAKSLDTTHL